MNAEKGEGPELRERYGISGYPTLLIVNPDGEEVDRVIGFRRPQVLLEALAPILEGKSFGALKKKVKEHPSDLGAALALAKKYEERRDFEKAEEIYDRIIGSQDARAELRQEAEGRKVLVGLYKSRGQEIAPVEEYFEKHKGTGSVVDHAAILFSLYSRGDDAEKVSRVAEYLLRHGRAEDPELLNNYAWYLATHDAKLERALELARKAVELSPGAPHIRDTLAEALFRTGRVKEAVEEQRRAVDLAPEERRQDFQERLLRFEKALKDERRRVRL